MPYKVITEEDFNRVAARNISFLFSHVIIEPEIDQKVIDHIYNELVDAIFYYRSARKKISDLCKNIDGKNGYEKGFTLRFFLLLRGANRYTCQTRVYNHRNMHN